MKTQKPTGVSIHVPMCGDWTCDDDEDWETIGPESSDYSARKRERAIALYHQPRSEWRERLREVRGW